MAPRHVGIEHTGLDANRQNILSPDDETPAIAAPNDPFDGTCDASLGYHKVTDCEILDAFFPVRGLNRVPRNGGTVLSCDVGTGYCLQLAGANGNTHP